MARERASNRAKSWAGGTFNVTTMGTTQVIVVSATQLVAKETLIRSRGKIGVEAIPDAVTDTDVLGLGLIVVQGSAADVGGVSVPGPIEDTEADWLWHQFVPLISGGTSESTDLGNNMDRQVVEVDSKAMRRMNVGEAVILVGQLAFGDFATVVVTGGVRWLFMHG